MLVDVAGDANEAAADGIWPPEDTGGYGAAAKWWRG